MAAYQVQFTVTAFVSTDTAVSPARIEERMLEHLEEVVFDPAVGDIEERECFGYITNVGVINHTEDK